MVTREGRVAGAEESALRKCVRLMVNSSAAPISGMLPDRFPFAGKIKGLPEGSIRRPIHPRQRGSGALGGRWEKVLLALDRLGESLEQQRQVLFTVHKIDF